MNYKVIINPLLGGNNTGNSSNNIYEKDINLKYSKILNDKLNNNGINSILVRNNDVSMSDIDRVNYINSIKNNNSLIISIGLDSDNIELIYGLKNNDNLVKRISDSLENNNYTVSKYYQRRDSTNTNLDYDYIIRELPNNESIIIKLGNISNITYLNDNIETITDIIVNVLKSYLGLSNDYYIVKKGDNLYSIARQYNTTVDTIKKLNNLTSNTLSIGQKLIIKDTPTTNNTNNNYYIVNKGDTLYSISRKYNTSIDSIKSINNLTSNILSIGQKLLIPNNSNDYYIVKKGDTLYSIANKYNTTVLDIMNINNLNSTNLSINQKLIIPK